MTTYSIPFVCAFGIITVFVSLIAIVLLSTVMSAIVRATEKKASAPAAAAAAAPAPAPAAVAPQQDPQLMAAITAAIAEDLGVSFSNVRITAIKKV